MTDSERIDALEEELQREPFVLHNLQTLPCGHYRGLGLLGGRRTLREAIDAMCIAKATEQR